MSENKDWIQGVTAEMKRKGTVGSFTKQAKRHDMSVHDFAEKVKNNPDDYSKRTKARANLALTFEKMAKDRKGKYAHGGTTQGYRDRQDESLGMRTGRASSKTQDMRARREDSYGKWGKRGAENRGTSMKHGGSTQGYNDQLDESLGMRTGTGKTQSYKDRRDESKGANRHLGRRAYSSVESMDTDDRINKTRDDILQKGWQMENGGTFAKGGNIAQRGSDAFKSYEKFLKSGDNITIEGNPYKKDEDFFIYRDGREVVSWGVDEREEDEFGDETAKVMYDLFKTDKPELSHRLNKIDTMRVGYAKGGTLSEKAVKKNYIRRDRYDKLKKEKDAKIDELKDANKDKVSDLKKDLKDKGADCYDDIKQTKKDIGKKIAKEMQRKQLDYEQGCADDIEEMSKDCDSQVEEMAELGSSIQGNSIKRMEKEKTESLILGGIGGLLIGMFFIK